MELKGVSLCPPFVTPPVMPVPKPPMLIIATIEKVTPSLLVKTMTHPVGPRHRRKLAGGRPSG
jgi:hypothetical protein